MKRKFQNAGEVAGNNAVSASLSRTGGPGDDRLVATADSQTLDGRDGDDRLDGGGYIGVTLRGGDGDDDLDAGGGDAARLEGGDGNDRLFGYTIDGFFAGGRGSDMMLVSDYCGADGGAGDDFLYCQSDNFGARGGSGDDILFAGVDDAISGDAGNDVLVARGSEADGGAGRDLIFAATTGTSRGGTGDDTLVTIDQCRAVGDGGKDLLVGLAAGSTLEGGAGRDVLLGTLAEDGVVMDGGADADLLVGSRFADLLTGGAGADTFYFAPGGQHDRVTDFSPGDRLDFSAYDFTSADEVLATARPDDEGVTFDLGGGDQVTLEGVGIDGVAAAAIVTSGGEQAVFAAMQKAQQALDWGQARLDDMQDDIQLLFEIARGTPSGPTELPVTELDFVMALADAGDDGFG